MSPAYRGPKHYRLVLILGIVIVLGLLIVQCAVPVERWPAWARRFHVNTPAPAATATPATTPLRIGYLHTPLLASLFAAAVADKGEHYRLVSFASGEEMGYALNIGEIDAGFFNPAAVDLLLAQQKAATTGLRVAGAIEFPYGATLVVRQGFDKRLTELAGSTIGAGEPDCVLLKQLQSDATKKLHADVSNVHWVYLDDDNLVPALNARKIDGAVVKADVAMLAVATGASILYQHWDVQGKDECCPIWSKQADSLLVVAPGHATAVTGLMQQLEQVSKTASREELDRAVVSFLNYPVKALDGNWPRATFTPLSQAVREHFAQHLWSGQ